MRSFHSLSGQTSECITGVSIFIAVVSILKNNQFCDKNNTKSSLVTITAVVTGRIRLRLACRHSWVYNNATLWLKRSLYLWGCFHKLEINGSEDISGTRSKSVLVLTVSSESANKAMACSFVNTVGCTWTRLSPFLTLFLFLLMLVILHYKDICWVSVASRPRQAYVDDTPIHRLLSEAEGVAWCTLWQMSTFLQAVSLFSKNLSKCLTIHSKLWCYILHYPYSSFNTLCNVLLTRM